MKALRILHCLTATAALALLAACSTPFKTPVFESRPVGQTSFSGISQLLMDAHGHNVDLLIVHGMCTHGQDWAESTIKALNSALGGADLPHIQGVPVDGTKTFLYQANLSLPGGTVRTSALVWSPIIAELKSQLCYDQTTKSESCSTAGAYPYQRASINRALKDSLLDDCLADAIIYQGKSRDAISEQMQKAILTAVSATEPQAAFAEVKEAAVTATAPLVVVTESLGSKIAFDAILKMVTNRASDDIGAAGRQTFDRTTQIFMSANQMPLLALADQSLNGVPSFRASDTSFQPDPLAALFAQRTNRLSKADSPKPRVMAFTDPNDLLSYILVPAKQTATYDVTDILVSNTNTYFGLLERPDTAHTGYLKNPEVIKLIACGNKAGSSCKSR